MVLNVFSKDFAIFKRETAHSSSGPVRFFPQRNAWIIFEAHSRFSFCWRHHAVRFYRLKPDFQLVRQRQQGYHGDPATRWGHLFVPGRASARKEGPEPRKTKGNSVHFLPAHRVLPAFVVQFRHWICVHLSSSNVGQGDLFQIGSRFGQTLLLKYVDFDHYHWSKFRVPRLPLLCTLPLPPSTHRLLNKCSTNCSMLHFTFELSGIQKYSII